jgi:hypothetical protein
VLPRRRGARGQDPLPPAVQPHRLAAAIGRMASNCSGAMILRTEGNLGGSDATTGVEEDHLVVQRFSAEFNDHRHALAAPDAHRLQTEAPSVGL